MSIMKEAAAGRPLVVSLPPRGPCRNLGERALQAALNVLAAAVEGVGGGHRHAQAVQQVWGRECGAHLGGGMLRHSPLCILITFTQDNHRTI